VSEAELPSVALAALVYGDAVATDDAAEGYHEASRLSPATGLAQLPGLQLLREEPALQASTTRAARRHPHRPSVELGRPRRLRARLDEVFDRRRSALGPHRRALPRADLAALLAAAYGTRQRDDGLRRAVPSGGALYPLELYPVALAVERVPPALYHFDPYDLRLARLDEAVPERLAATLVDPTLLDRASAFVAIAAVFWRTRFKYGQRGYRFALLEAGHVAQNLVLAAAALGIPALPLGGFYDRRLDDLLGLDGVDEATLYAILIGGRG
jgi:SagB-type dehydrogenase family enzyme